jgi:hypothetical protein
VPSRPVDEVEFLKLADLGVPVAVEGYVDGNSMTSLELDDAIIPAVDRYLRSSGF